jgi:chloramphenicol 3-O-phosphotransferase
MATQVVVTPVIQLQRERDRLANEISRVIVLANAFRDGSAVLQASANGTIPSLGMDDFTNVVANARRTLSDAAACYDVVKVAFDRVHYLEHVGTRRQNRNRRRDVSVFFRSASVQIQVSYHYLLAALDHD